MGCKLLQSKAIAVENDLRATLRNFGLKVGMVGTVKHRRMRSPASRIAFFVGSEETPSSRDSGGSGSDDQNVEVKFASKAGKCRTREGGHQPTYGAPARQFEGFQPRRH